MQILAIYLYLSIFSKAIALLVRTIKLESNLIEIFKLALKVADSTLIYHELSKEFLILMN